MKPPIPPLPPLPTIQRGLIGTTSTATLLSVPSPSSNPFAKSGKGRKGKSKDINPPDVPPKEQIERILPLQVTGGTDLGSMDGIIDLSLVGSGSLDASAFPYTGPSSPSRSSQSASDHGSTYGVSVGQQAPPVVWGNPFSLSVASPSTSSVATATLGTTNGKRVAYQPRPSLVDPRKVSTSASIRNGHGAALTVPIDPSLDLTKIWLAPESWHVEKEKDESFSAEGGAAEPDGASESDSEVIPPVTDRKRSTRSEIRLRNGSETSGPNSGVNKPLPSFGLTAPPDFQYCLKIYRPNQTYHVVSLKTTSKVADLNGWMAKKNMGIDATQWSLYLIELGRGMFCFLSACWCR